MNALIIYDGDCIFCQNYVRLVHLREMVGKVDLVDARSDDPRVAEYQRQGYDLNEGMIFVWNGRVYHGSDAVNVLGGLSTTTTWFNTINRMVFSSPLASRALYPLLKIGRRITLLVRGKDLIARP